MDCADATRLILVAAAGSAAVVYWVQLIAILYWIFKVGAVVLLTSLYWMSKNDNTRIRLELEVEETIAKADHKYAILFAKVFIPLFLKHACSTENWKNIIQHEGKILKELDDREKIKEKNEIIELLKSSCDGLRREKQYLESLVQKRSEELKNMQCKVEELKRLQCLMAAYEKFRLWMEDEALNGRLCFTMINPSDKELVDILSNSNHREFLGKGTYGSVHKTKFRGMNVAIKILNEKTKEKVRGFEQEVEILRKVRHPNLVTLVGACIEKSVLIYEWLPKGTLGDHLLDERRGSFTWEKRVKVATNICSGLVFLHNTTPKPIAHGDLKPSNILFDSNDECKISDFGISRLLDKTDKGTAGHMTDDPKGSMGYMDPYFRETHKLTRGADVYSFGVILLQLGTGQYITNLVKNVICGKLEALQYNELLDKNLELNEESKKDAMKMIDLGLKCIKEEPHRPELHDVWWAIEGMKGNNLTG